MSATVEPLHESRFVEKNHSLLDDIITRMSAIEARQARPSPVHLRTWQEIERFAEKAAKSGMVPKDYVGKPDAICIAVQMGSELGLAPMQAIQNIAVINGRPSIWGDAMLALCKASPLCSDIEERYEGDGETLTAICVAKRVGKKPVIKTFSVEDAKRANLWKTTPKITKQGRDGPYEVDSGPWYSYPARMLQMRARGFALRDAFPDVLKGLISREEAFDIPADEEPIPAPTTIHIPGPKPDKWDAWLDKLEAEASAIGVEDTTAWDKLWARQTIVDGSNKLEGEQLARFEQIKTDQSLRVFPGNDEEDPNG